MLDGIRIKPITRNTDERGFFCEVMRNDWTDFFAQDQIKQVNNSYTYPGIIRAWHRHLRGQTDYFLTLKGAMKICAYDDKTAELTEIISNETNLQIVRVPGHYWHGFKAINNQPALLIYFTTNLYNQLDPDEERRPWNDPKLIPITINNNKNDPRTRQPWDWNYPPHK